MKRAGITSTDVYKRQLFTPEVIADADILYMTRVQRERFTDMEEYERVKDVYLSLIHI